MKEKIPINHRGPIAMFARHTFLTSRVHFAGTMQSSLPSPIVWRHSMLIGQTLVPIGIPASISFSLRWGTGWGDRDDLIRSFQRDLKATECSQPIFMPLRPPRDSYNEEHWKHICSWASFLMSLERGGPFSFNFIYADHGDIESAKGNS